jgi:hypothetical protein
VLFGKIAKTESAAGEDIFIPAAEIAQSAQ